MPPHAKMHASLSLKVLPTLECGTDHFADYVIGRLAGKTISHFQRGKRACCSGFIPPAKCNLS